MEERRIKFIAAFENVYSPEEKFNTFWITRFQKKNSISSLQSEWTVKKYSYIAFHLCFNQC